MTGEKAQKIKRFFSEFSFKEKCAVIFRILMVLLCLIALFVMRKKININGNEQVFAILFFTGAVFFFRPLFFLLFYWPFFLLLILDVHLFRTYGLSFSSVGVWIFSILGDTNKQEVVEYLARVRWSEWLSLLSAIVCSIGVFLCAQKKIPVSAYWRRMVIFVLLLTYAFGYMMRTYPVIASQISSERREILKKAASFKFNPEKEGHKADTVVVLIGESHRQAEFAPAFEKYVSSFKNLYLFKDVASTYPGTLRSVPMILSRKKASDYSEFFHEKSIFSLFKEAGYETYFVHYSKIASEKNALGVIYTEADNFIQYSSETVATTDEEVAKVLDNLLKNEKKKKLIVIKMIGLHIDFRNRYPNDEPKLDAFKARTKEGEMRFYRNAISYSAGIIADIMKRIEQRSEPSLLLFSSDHGICIFDKGYFHLPATCQNAFHVPAMILMNSSLARVTSDEAKKMLSCNRDKPLTEEFYFETIASLSGVSYPSANNNYDLTRVCNPLNGKKRPVFSSSSVLTKEALFYEDL